MYNVFTQNGYIFSIVKDPHGNVTDEECQSIVAALRDRPTAPEGYDYRLTTSPEGELYRLPAPEREDDEEATESDYLASLAEVGVE